VLELLCRYILNIFNIKFFGRCFYLERSKHNLKT
jgi:hypothetical protein